MYIKCLLLSLLVIGTLGIPSRNRRQSGLDEYDDFANGGNDDSGNTSLNSSREDDSDNNDDDGIIDEIATRTLGGANEAVNRLTGRINEAIEAGTDVITDASDSISELVDTITGLGRSNDSFTDTVKKAGNATTHVIASATSLATAPVLIPLMTVNNIVKDVVDLGGRTLSFLLELPTRVINYILNGLISLVNQVTKVLP